SSFFTAFAMAFTNAPPLMSPTRAKMAALGTNPIAMAAPGIKGDSFILDMATTSASLGKIEMQLRKGEPIPEGWALDGNGNPTTDPKVAMEQGSLLPLGGLEPTSGYKGYGLALMVETLCGILGGANYGPYIKKYNSEDTRPANLGHCFVVINPDCFAPGFNERMSNLMNALRSMEPVDPKKPVLVPGDPERAFMKQVDKQGGIRYHTNLIKSLEDIAHQDTLFISFIKRKFSVIMSSGLQKMLTSQRALSGVSVLTAVIRRASHNMAVVPVHEARRFMIESLIAVGTSERHATQLADVLVAADHQGHFSHGLNRLDMYVDDIRKKTTDPNVEPVILKEGPATAWVDGKNGLGPVVGNFCMDLAIKKAKNVGVGWVSAKGSNHFGIAGWYSRTALNNNMLGMSFTNTSPLMSPTRATMAALGTNPISLAAPAKNGDSFVLDMATTAVAVGKIEVQIKKGEPIPEGWAQGPDGKTTTDAQLGFDSRCLMPLGGAELTSGYKGYGLGLLVETFCGILSGSEFGPNVRKWMEETDRPANLDEEPNLGHCFVAIDPKCFAPGFENRMQQLMDYLRNMEP
ncbi:hypothetical protein L9F63_000269, partial [Diploptera punctata]